ncbi:CoA transferase [Aquamicrobium sp. NLF2-7]|uniref:CaiB/BaiF CoA transferase family protein n=1 Tax=Aquamicrobium sp. NLF2-7 TaxID=2918753 RepID=UPI001EFBF8AB|nr:CoA transferase [Aquamicrobium sp. NLF2-7]MCG8274572.1 CoA transferase [Aquamicrobium sp. NLF2-7]
MPDHKRPLEGLRVLDIATFIAAPLAASILGEFGAEVIKIEQPREGDPLRRFGVASVETPDTFCWLSEARNKKSVTLDLRSPEGAGILRELAAQSDIICENFRPGTLEKWGLGFDELCKLNPRLIMLRISGYGQSGPYKDRPGFARIAHAFGGLAHLTGMADGPPLTPGSTSLADYASGVYGALGVMLALRARERDGVGQYIDLALYEPIMRMLDDLVPAYAARGIVRGRQGLGTSNACPHGHFQTTDGWIAIACTNDRMFTRLAKTMGRPELALPDRYATTAARLRDSAIVDGIVQAWVGEMTTNEAVTTCAENDVPCAAVNTIAGIFADPHIAERQNQIALHHESLGDVFIPAVVPKLSRTPGHVDSLGPSLGASNAEILGGLLGMDEAKMRQLKNAGII